MRAYNIARTAVKNGAYEIDWASRGNGQSGMRFEYERRGKDDERKESWGSKEDMPALKETIIGARRANKELGRLR